MINEHVTAYLDGYLEKPASFAVLVSGPWGSGKTFVTKRYLLSRGTDHLYVSVNGVRDTTEIRRRLVYEAYPLLGDKTMQALGSLAKSAAGIFRFNTELTPGDLVNLDGVQTFVVDDIERAQIPIEELLGFLNSFVEHDNKHLILIGNESELLERGDYKRIKEKTIGFVLGVNAEINSAISALSDQLSAAYWKFLHSNIEHIKATFKASSSENLRVLRQTIIESEIIYEVSSGEISLSEQEIVEVLTLYIALSLAYKEGKISRGDIAKRITDKVTRVFVSQRTDNVATPLEILDKSLPNVDIFSSVLDNEFLERKLCDGIDDLVALSRSLNDVKARTDASRIPEWRNLWYYMRSPDDLTRGEYLKFSDKFANRQYKDSGTILHAFGLQIEMARIGLSNLTRQQIRNECIGYLDDLQKAGEIPSEMGRFSGGRLSNSSGGLGFMNSDDVLFQELRRELVDRGEAVHVNEVKAKLRCAIENGDADQLSRILSQSGDVDSLYSSPILNEIDPRWFAEKILKLPGDTQFSVFIAIGSRYENNPHAVVLKTELPWLKKARGALLKLIPPSDKLLHFRISQLIKWNFPEAAWNQRQPKAKNG